LGSSQIELMVNRMPKKSNDSSKTSPRLKGWAAIAEFLGQTPSVAQRWHHQGMPVTIEGRFVYAEPNELTRWVGTEAGRVKPLHIASKDENLVEDLIQGLKFVKGKKK
jgi:hypothetical protein